MPVYSLSQLRSQKNVSSTTCKFTSINCTNSCRHYRSTVLHLFRINDSQYHVLNETASTLEGGSPQPALKGMSKSPGRIKRQDIVADASPGMSGYDEDKARLMDDIHIDSGRMPSKRQTTGGYNEGSRL